jgi:MraZ protein
MVIGQFSSHVGSGNRVTFPKKFSKEEGNFWLITKGLDQNLIMVSETKKQILLEGIETKPYIPANIRQKQAFVLGNTFEITLDDSNRFVIPPSLCRYAGITTEVIFAGIENFVFVWNSKQWEDYQRHIQPAMEKIFDLPGNE